MPNVPLKVALVHDALVNRGGAERVFQVFSEMFPRSPIYTSVYLPDKTFPYFHSRKVFATPLQKLVRTEAQFKMMFPLALWYMQKIVLKDYDLVLSSSTFCGKYVRVLPPAVHVCYCYTPFRLLWQTDSYFHGHASQIKNKALLKIAEIFRCWDYKSSQRVDFFVTMTPETNDRIRNAYGKEAKVVPPPIDCSQYKTSPVLEDYFLVVSRLETYKKVDIAVDAFNQLGRKLKIIGNGSQKGNLLRRANKNIQFVGSVSDGELKEYVARCKAVIFPQKEDYGLVPLEANASGRPVIAFGEGGICATMIPYDGHNLSKATAIFFHNQTSDGLIQAVRDFENIHFDVDALVENARRFDKAGFATKIRFFLRERLGEPYDLATDLS